MELDLSELKVEKLLEKFGAGEHKPGSGSAAALSGKLSSQLLKTVIDLTNDPKRATKYSAYLPTLLNIKEDINSRIYPSLTKLFQEDSDQFDKVIRKRKERDSERNFATKQKLANEEMELVIPATEIPLQIAALCVDLAEYSIFVFDKGFRSARGDSSVALQNTVSVIGGCLSIAELNLCSLPLGERIEELRRQKNQIREKYDFLRLEEIARLDTLSKESEEHKIYLERVEYFKNGNLSKGFITNLEIEEIAIKLNDLLWDYRHKIYKNTPLPETDFDLINPGTVIEKLMGYNFQMKQSLGFENNNGVIFEIAGLIDREKKLVQISKDMPIETQKFTTAHELGHLILHKQGILHRDRPIDGSITPKNLLERQADRFASYFLMPGTTVFDLFRSIFETDRFTINEETSFNLLGRSGQADALRKSCKNLRGLSRLMASLKTFKANQIIPLHKIFEVSVEAMAIRLEELKLVAF